MFEFLMRRLFGRDLFISYSRPDASEYVRVLAAKVREEKKYLSICIDQWAARPYQTTHPNLLREARRSSLFVLVASENAVKSANVGAEIDAFLKKGRYLLAINVDGNLAKPSVWSAAAKTMIATTSPIDELGTALDPKNPQPSPRVVTRVLGAVTFETQTQRIRHDTIRAIAFVAAIITGVALFSWVRIGEVNADRALADSKQRFAEQRAIRANAEARDAVDRAEAANAAAVAAEGRATTAEGRATAAEGRATAAEQRATLADTEAKRQQEVALALRLANESAQWRQQPAHVVRALHLATEAVARLDRLGMHAMGADMALREAVALNPIFERSGRIPGNMGREAISDDGKYVAVSEGEKLYLCDTATIRCQLLDERSESGTYMQVAFSRDSKALAAAFGPTVRIWNAETGEPMGTPFEVLPLVGELSIGPGGRMVAVSAGNTFDVRDVTGKPLVPARQHGEVVMWLEISPDGEHLITVDQTDVRVWVSQSSEKPKVLATGKNPTSATFSPDGKRIATVDQTQGMTIWDWQNEKSLWIADLAPLVNNPVRFSPDGKRIAASQSTGGLRVYDVEKAHTVFSLDVLAPRFAFSRDGSLIVTGANHGARVWRIADGRELGHATHGLGWPLVAFDGGGRIVSAMKGEMLRVWRLNESLPVGAKIATQARPDSVAFDPRTNDLAVASSILGGMAGTPQLHRVNASGSVTLCRDLPSDQVTMAFTTDGWLLTAGRDRQVHVWEQWCSSAPERKPLLPRTDAAIRRLALGGGDALLALAAGNIVQIAENWRDANATYTSLIHPRETRAVTFIAGGDVLATGDAAGRVRLWNWRTDPRRAVREIRFGPIVESLAADRSGRFLAVGGGFAAKVFDLSRQSDEPVATLAHDNIVGPVAFDPTGQFLLTGSGDGMAHVWEGWASGAQREVTRLKLDNNVEHAAFSPDGSLIAAMTDRGNPYTIVTRWRPRDLLDAACGSIESAPTPEQWNRDLPGVPYAPACGATR